MNEQQRKPDRRIIKTRRAIRIAFAELLTIKDINEITIKDIADKADINRKTFYNYYNGIYEVINEVEDEIVASLDEMFTEVEFTKESQTASIIFEKLTTVINSNIEFYCQLLKRNGNADLINKMLNVLKKKVKEAFFKQSPISEQAIDFMTDYCISGLLSTYQNWFNSNRSITIEQLSSDLTTIMFDGLNGFIIQKNSKITNP